MDGGYVYDLLGIGLFGTLGPVLASSYFLTPNGGALGRALMMLFFRVHYTGYQYQNVPKIWNLPIISTCS
jgi:hypothetical protein